MGFHMSYVFALGLAHQELDHLSKTLKVILGTGEMTSWLRALTTPTEDLGSNPGTHMVALKEQNLLTEYMY